MTTSWNPNHRKKRYESAGSVVLDRVKLGQAPVSLHRIRWTQRGLWVLLALAVIGGGLGLWLTLDARFYVYDAQIVGNRSLTQGEIFEASGLRGLHILWARSGAIESQILETLPSLERVEASCRLPSTCTISVVERRPRVLWNENGELWWIDEAGAIFPARDGRATATMESGSDEADASALAGTEVRQVDSLSDASRRWTVTGPLPRNDAGNLDDQVRVTLSEVWESGRELPAEFQYGPEQGLSFVDERGWHIFLGEGGGVERRLRVLDRLIAHLESRGVTPRFVDVRFPEAPYYAAAAD